MRKIFTPAEVRAALQDGRVFCLTPDEGAMPPEYRDFQLVFFARRTDRMVVADAWHVNARGCVHPDEHVPVPVRLSEVSHLDFASPEVRLALLRYAEEAVNEETRVTSELLSSHAETWKILNDAKALPTKGSPSAKDFERVVKPYARQALRGSDVDLRKVDWAEVASYFDVESSPSFQEQVEVAGKAVAPKLSIVHQSAEEVAEAVEEKKRPVPPEVLEVLKGCSVDGLVLRLPAARLDPKLYKRVNEVLVLLGGTWKSGKTQGHVFDEDPSGLLDAVVSSGVYLNPKDYGFFATARSEADRVIALAQLEFGMKVLEPQAGRGGIAIPLAEAVGGKEYVTVCEILEGNVQKLREAGFPESNIVHADFLSIKPQPVYSRVLMNPPFGRLQDIDHFMHAAKFLAPEGRIVAIMSPSWEFHTSKKAQEFRDFVEECSGEVEQIEAGAFKSVGTNVRTTIIAMDAENLPWNRIDRRREGMRA